MFVKSSKEKDFEIIYSLIKGEIVIAKGFNTSLQYAFYDRERLLYENTH